MLFHTRVTLGLAARPDLASKAFSRNSANVVSQLGVDSERPARHLRKTELVVGFNLDDGVVSLRPCGDKDAEWYAQSTGDTEVQRFTTNPPALSPEEVLATIRRVRSAGDEEAFVMCDAATNTRLGSIHLGLDGRIGEVSYWLAAEERGREAATRALNLVSSWAF